MLRVGTFVMGAENLERAISFWSQALGYVVKPDPTATDGFAILDPPSGDVGRIALHLSDAVVQDHPRVHLDLYAGDAEDQAAEVDRLIALGATRVPWDDYPEDADYVVLADTEGNRFCVIDTLSPR